MSVSCSLEVACLERADLLALFYMMFLVFFVTFLCDFYGQVGYLSVSIPNLCLLSYLLSVKSSLASIAVDV